MKKFYSFITLFFMISFMAGITSSYAQNFWHVAETGNDGNPGDSANPFLNIQYAIGQAGIGDFIWVHYGNYTLTATVDFMGKDVYVVSGYGMSEYGDASQCLIDAAGNDGFSFTSGESYDAKLYGFSIFNADVGVYISGANPEVNGCFIYNCTGDGIYAEYSDSAVFMWNVIYDNEGAGIYFGKCNEGLTIDDEVNESYFNTIVFNDMEGIAIDSSWVGMLGNIIAYNGTGIANYNAGAPPNVEGEYNNVFGNMTDFVNFSLAFSSISEDPLFNDQDFRDFTLQAASPCIDVLDPAYGTEDDGTVRDIGALPFDQSGGGEDIVEFNFMQDSVCPPAWVSFTNESNITSYGGEITWEWDIGGIFYFSYEPPDTLLNEGHHVVILTAYDDVMTSLGSVMHDFDICMSVDPGENFVQFSFWQDVGCEPQDVSFSNESSFTSYSGEVNWEWNINGFPYYGFELPDTVLYEGSYYVTLTAYDSLWNWLGDMWHDFYVCAGGGGWVDFDVWGYEGCAPVTVSFSNNSWFDYYDGTITYRWDINGTMYEGEVLPDTVLLGGHYNVHLDAYDSLMNNMGMHDYDFQVWGTPTMFKTSAGMEACPGEPVQFFVEVDDWWIVWDFGNYQYEYNNHTTRSFPVAGTYEVTVIFEHDCGIDTLTQDFIVSDTAKPHVEIWTDGQSFCPNDDVTFHTNAKYSSYLWDFGDGTTSTKEKPRHAYFVEEDSMFMVTLTATNMCGNTGTDTTWIYIQHNVPVWAGFDWWSEGGSEYVCPNTPVQFNAHSAGMYEWQFGDGGTSDMKEPMNYYPDTGLYEVQLVVYNGCGNADSSWQQIWVMYDPGYNTPWPQIGIEDDWMYFIDDEWSDTITICPGIEIMFENQTWESQDLMWDWDFGDGSHSPMREAAHVYNTPGEYEVNLTAWNNCGGEGMSNSKYIHVDASIMPMAGLEAVPMAICPDEEVYFWDDEMDYENSYNMYSIWFGDGDSLIDVMEPTDTMLQTLASHTYTTEGSYDFIFTVTNICNNVDSLEGTILVDNDATRKPFYYIGNSTGREEKSMIDWSVRRDPTDHEFIIPVQWAQWNNSLDSTFYVFFFYGGFYFEEEKQGADGFVEIKGPGTAIAYVPYDYMEEDVGMLGAWYCTPEISLGEIPEVYALPLDPIYGPINYFPLEEAGTTDLTATPIIFPVWDGICNSERPSGDWIHSVDPGFHYFLELNEGHGGYDPDYYSGRIIGDEDMGMWEWWSEGTYMISNDTIYFYDDYHCNATGIYKFTLTEMMLSFTLVSDECTDRIETFTTGSFVLKHPDEEYEDNQTGCIGDPVIFQIAGGDSYEWFFGDGSSTTGQVVQHTYADTGSFDAFAIATNACGRIDTLYTPVRIDTTNLPHAWFWMDRDWAEIYDTIHFYYEEDWDGDMMDVDNKSYLWSFGDGTTSTLREPYHVYTGYGEYVVTLTVTNGCGSRTGNMFIYIEQSFNRCDIEAKFIFEVEGDTVWFMNATRGEPTHFSWDFGMGNSSDEEDPMFVFPGSGMYPVCLTVYDSITDCYHMRCMNIIVGTIDCYADFNYYTNVSTNTVFLVDASVGNITEWYWDFGDGNMDTVPDPVHSYELPGIYEVCLYIYDEGTDCYAEDCQIISIGELECNAEFTYFIDGNTVSFTNESSGVITYGYWSFGDGNFATTPNPTHTYSEPGLYVVCGSIFDSISGCQSEICKEIQIGTLECVADFSYFANPALNTITFTNKSTGATDWFWDFGNGNYSVKKNPTFTAAAAGIYEVCIYTYDSVTGCQAEACKEIVLGSVECGASFSYFVNPTDNSVTFTNQSTGSISNYYWDFGDGAYDTIRTPSHTYSQPGFYWICLFIYDMETGCYAEVCEELQVGTIECDADFTYFLDPENLTVSLSDNSMGDPTEWYWDFGDGDYSVDNDTITHTYAYPGVYWICMYMYDSLTYCFSDVCYEIMVGDSADMLCKTDFSTFVDPATNKVVFTNTSSGDVTDAYWDFGDGYYSTDVDTTDHTYVESGVYYVCLYTYDSVTYCYSEKCMEISISTGESTAVMVNADFAYFIDPTTNNVAFNDKSTGNITNWYWTFGDGSYVEAQDTSHTYMFPGFYTVCLYIFDSSTGGYAEACKEIQVGSVACNVNASFNKFINATTQTITLTDKSTGGVNSWFWNFGDGNTSYKQSPTHTYTNPGYYMVSLAVRDTVNNCSDYTSDFIQIGSVDCKALFDYSVDVTTNTVTFTDKSRGSVANYFWYFDDGEFSTDTNAVHIYSGPGLYYVSLTVSDATGMCMDYYFKQVQVGTVDCSAAFTVYVDSASNTAYFTNAAVGASTNLYWIFGDGTISTDENPEHVFPMPGYYNVGLNTYNSANGCMDYYEEIVLIGSRGIDCEADFIYQVDDASMAVDFTDKSVGDNLSYYWDFNDGSFSTDQNPDYIYSEGGYYNVCLTVYDDVNIIQNTSCKFIQVAVDATTNCFAEFFYTVDSVNQTVTFFDNSYGDPDTWEWDFGNESSSIDQSPTHVYTTAGYYTVKLTATNSTNGCVSDYFDIVNVSMGNQGLQSGFGYEADSSGTKASGYPVDFVGVSLGDPAKVKWDFGDGSDKDSTSMSPTHVYTEYGTYTVCMTISDPLTGQSDETCHDVTTVAPEGIEDMTQNAVTLKNHPNPFSNYTNIIYSLPTTTIVEISIYDLLGSKLKTLVYTEKDAGAHSFIWDASDLESGIYYLYLNTPEGMVVNKMVIEK